MNSLIGVGVLIVQLFFDYYLRIFDVTAIDGTAISTHCCSAAGVIQAE